MPPSDEETEYVEPLASQLFALSLELADTSASGREQQRSFTPCVCCPQGAGNERKQLFG